MFQEVCLTSIQVLSQMGNCISASHQSNITLSTSQDVHLNSIQVPSQPHIGLGSCVSSPSRLPESRFFRSLYLHLGYIQATSHFHPGHSYFILVPSKQHLKHIQVLWGVSHLHPGPFQIEELYHSPFLVPYHGIHVSRCASQPHPGLGICVSSPSRLPDSRFFFVSVESHNQSGSWYLHLEYIQVTSHIHPGPPNCISVQPKHHLK